MTICPPLGESSEVATWILQTATLSSHQKTVGAFTSASTQVPILRTLSRGKERRKKKKRIVGAAAKGILSASTSYLRPFESSKFIPPRFRFYSPRRSTRLLYLERNADIYIKYTKRKHGMHKIVLFQKKRRYKGWKGYKSSSKIHFCLFG